MVAKVFSFNGVDIGRKLVSAGRVPAVQAVKAGFYETEYGKFPKIQILTIADLFAGNQPQLPWRDRAAFKKAAKELTSEQPSLPL